MAHNSFGQNYGHPYGDPNGIPNYPFSSPGSGGAVPAPATSSGPPKLYVNIRMAHAVLGLLAFGLFFPLGSILIRSSSRRSTVWLHACWQVFTLAMAVATMAIGIRMVLDPTQAANNFFLAPHTIIGLVTISLLLAMQPLTGFLHHLWFRRTGRRTAFSYAHILYGLPLITLGAINGGLGLQLSHEPLKYTVTYGVLAGLVWIVWMFISIVSQLGRKPPPPTRHTKKTGSDNEDRPAEIQSFSRREKRRVDRGRGISA